MSVLVAYASKHAATEGIATFIADRLRERGLDAAARRAEDVTGLEGSRPSCSAAPSTPARG